jgi:hypothetical protein
MSAVIARDRHGLLLGRGFVGMCEKRLGVYEECRHKKKKKGRGESSEIV